MESETFWPAVVVAVVLLFAAIVVVAHALHTRWHRTPHAPCPPEPEGTAGPEPSTERPVAPAWSVAANIVQSRRYGPGGAEIRHGTKHFRPGAKVFIIDSFPGMCENVVVIGHHRGSNRFANMVVRVEWLENFRTQLIYSPTVIRLIADSGYRYMDQAEAEKLCRALPLWRSSVPPASESESGRDDQ